MSLPRPPQSGRGKLWLTTCGSPLCLALSGTSCSASAEHQFILTYFQTKVNEKNDQEEFTAEGTSLLPRSGGKTRGQVGAGARI